MRAVQLTFSCVLAGAMAVVAAGADEQGKVMVDVGAKKVGSWGGQPGHVNHPQLRQPFSLNAGVASYSLIYSCCTHKSHAPNVATPEGYVGMPGPCSANWYHNGFLYIIVNGKDIGTAPLAAMRKGFEGATGSVELLWYRADTRVTATFLMRYGDPTLYLEVSVTAKEAPKSLAVHLTAYPVTYTSNGDRWAVTATRGIRQVHKQTLDVDKESWVLLQDHMLSRKGSHPGGCGLAFLPAELARAEVEVSRYPVHTKLVAKPGLARVRLALWDFHDKTDARARQYVESVATRTQHNLATLDFANPRLKPPYWAKLRAELAPLAAKVTGSARKLAGQIKKRIAAVDRLHAEIAALGAKGLAAPATTESRLLAELDALAESYWDLRLAALFADD